MCSFRCYFFRPFEFEYENELFGTFAILKGNLPGIFFFFGGLVNMRRPTAEKKVTSI